MTTGFRNFYFTPVGDEKKKFTTREEVKEWVDWVDSSSSGFLMINDDMTVDCGASFTGQSTMFAGHGNDKIIPVQFRIANANFEVNGCNLSSLDGCPREVAWKFSCWSNPLTSLEGCPKKASTMDFSWLFDVKTLRRIHELIDSCKTFYIPHTIQSAVLGLLLIEDMEVIKCKHVGQPDLQMDSVVRILNHHLNADRDVLECQEELATEGYVDFAKL